MTKHPVSWSRRNARRLSAVVGMDPPPVLRARDADGHGARRPVASADWFDNRLRDGYALEDPLHHLVRVDLLGFRLVGDDDAVAEDVRADGFHVLRGDVAAPLKERVRLGGERQV